MEILTIVGARPQFIKSAPVSKTLREAGHSEYLVHTGQHYDREMSQVFFDELGIAEPNINLGIGSGSHGYQTGQMLIQIEEIVQKQQPDLVLVYGDTNSTLAGALAAVKLHVPIAHVEAGLRSFNREMPEEHNRILTDHCANLLFCPTQTAVNHLRNEGIVKGVHLVGDTMYDAVLQFGTLAQSKSTILDKLGLQAKEYILATVHRPYNTDNAENLTNIIAALQTLEQPVIFPVHPRTKQRIADLDNQLGLKLTNSPLKLIQPVGYLDMLVLERSASLILTDSGGVQKEAYFFAVPCITMRPETEWVETVESGWNLLTDTDAEKIRHIVKKHSWPTGTPPAIFGDGRSSEQITKILTTVLPD